MSAPAPGAAPFSSYWMAGYEGADHVNHAGVALDMNRANGHISRVRADYALLAGLGIGCVRESVGWRLFERDGRYDFGLIEDRARVAQELGIQICWSFCHYGWPADIDVYSAGFVPRFARFCRAVAECLAPFGGPAPVYSPVNEISFTSWGLSVRMFRCLNMDYAHAARDAKRQLVRAAIAGCDAIWQVSPGARLLHCDPLIHIVPPAGRPDLAADAAGWHQAQFQAWDMLCGRLEPELGGAMRYLDLLGANYYDTNQWETGTNARLWWHLGDGRRRPLHSMLGEVYQRYRRPLLLAETSHVGSGRGVWIREVAEQVAMARLGGVEAHGICLYPAIDRPDWDRPDWWHHSGIWDVDQHGADPLARLAAPAYMAGLRQAQRLSCCFFPAPVATPPSETVMQTIIVFCHLRWNFVYQRPQQLLTQMARHYKVIYIEEPLFSEGQSFLDFSQPGPNMTVCQPHTPSRAAGFHDDQIALLQPLLAALVRQDDDPVVWFYTPMALPLLAALHPCLVVYDCMDELAAFKNPPKQLLQRETALLRVADVVFTGGPSLHEAKRRRHANTHFFPSSVDAVHFEQALDRTNVHPLQAGLAGPRLGFYGVIDERFDSALLARLADAHPEWQLVMIGPVVKIDPASLPQRANIHYFGQQSYQALPQFLAGWDVCLLPFALNEATRYISPTKVLEYMAAELPIVSTAIRDVERPWGHVVAIGHHPQEFIAACEAALAHGPQQRATLAQQMRAIVAATSWEGTADAMRAVLARAARPATAAATPAPAPAPAPASVEHAPAPRTVSPVPAPAAVQQTGCAIVGAGPTGLSAAYHLGADTVLLERHASVGGWCRSVQQHGFTFDCAGHIMFSDDPYVLALYDILLGSNQHWQLREAWVYSKAVYTRYPFQGALYGLPPAVISECIMGAVEARYGAGAAGAEGAGRHFPVADCCADGTTDLSCAPAALAGQPANFEAFIYQVWGAGIARHFAIPYNKKIWTVPLTDMETSWLGGRVPLPDLAQIIEGALSPVAKPMGPNARFGYPKQGGFQALMNGFLPHIEGEVSLNAEVAHVDPAGHMLALADGRRIRYQQLISTMPLPELVTLIGAAAPPAVRDAARGLQHISIRCVNLGVARPGLTDKHWIYYPEEPIFHRIFVQGNASPECNAPGGFGLTCEISYSRHKPLPCDGAQLIGRCVADCIAVGLLTTDDVLLTSSMVDMPYAYVVYDHQRAANVATVRSWLEQHDITLAGRYSEWEYYNSDHAFLAGKKAAEQVRDRLAAPAQNAST
jgi:protoporphyrinogen oxidase/glycosyltransferase involved in cell wall biosynthesis